MNADGWGVGWWDPAVAGRAGPLPHRRADVDRPVVPLRGRGGARAAPSSPPSAAPPRRRPIVDTGNAPFAPGRGCSRSTASSSGFRGPVGERLRRARQPRRAPPRLEGTTDSEVLFALVLDALDAGAEPADAPWPGSRPTSLDAADGRAQPPPQRRRTRSSPPTVRQLPVHARRRRPRRRRRARRLRAARRRPRLDRRARRLGRATPPSAAPTAPLTAAEGAA